MINKFLHRINSLGFQRLSQPGKKKHRNIRSGLICSQGMRRTLLITLVCWTTVLPMQGDSVHLDFLFFIWRCNVHCALCF
ncbi:hypothetical protein K503DRAFT_29791 [Rhizopogon vinicolor AM-OR11-026]|uniref:Uncharacterized protein n=1 Tax=Rhizopogon vinicolor AM-OR11-026 TaxID=1314800 RepID=A0A1B7N5A4_9AGAM|nr:hypothetical protein K503DRAFT_29791 [Rhizopogon vinicolor AM-OR11-026]